MGKPIVATRDAATGIEHEAGSDILIADEPAQIGDAVLRLIADDGLRNSIGAAARSRIVSEYRWEDTLKTFRQRCCRRCFRRRTSIGVNFIFAVFDLQRLIIFAIIVKLHAFRRRRRVDGKIKNVRTRIMACDVAGGFLLLE